MFCFPPRTSTPGHPPPWRLVRRSSERVLRIAASDGNIEAVKRQLAAGANVNAPNTYGYTSLHNATDFGHKEIAELLIAKGADVNAMNKD